MNKPRFPLFIDLQGKKIAVIGGGSIAQRRIETLLCFGADIHVTAPELTPRLAALAAAGSITWRQEAYAPDAAADCFLLLAATNDPEVNHEAVSVAKKQGIWSNNAANQAENDFFFPAIAREKNLVVGICGDGTDHGAVKRAASRIRTALSEGEDQ